MNDQLFLFCGRSGIGKSTLAAQLKLKGYRLFSDDKCLLLSDGNDAWKAKPGLKIMRLWQDALDSLNFESFLSNPKEVVLRKDKFQFEINENDLVSEDQMLHSVFIINHSSEDDKVSHRKLLGLEKLKRFRNQIFRLVMVSKMDLDKELWHLISEFLKTIPVYLVVRPKEIGKEEFAEYMNNLIKKLSDGIDHPTLLEKIL